jgi:hypothetical protein
MSRECELQFEKNSNHSHNHGTWTTIRDKQQSLTFTGHELKFKINRNHSHTHGTWTVPWVCGWLLFISNCSSSSCPVSVWVIAVKINSNHSHTHGTWTTIRDKQQSLTHSCDMNYNSRKTAITHTITEHELQFEINSNHSHSRIVVHVPWVCEWLLFISNCSSCRVSV